MIIPPDKNTAAEFQGEYSTLSKVLSIVDSNLNINRECMVSWSYDFCCTLSSCFVVVVVFTRAYNQHRKTYYALALMVLAICAGSE